MRRVMPLFWAASVSVLLLPGCGDGAATGTKMNEGTVAEGNALATNPAALQSTDMKKQMDQAKHKGAAPAPAPAKEKSN